MDKVMIVGNKILDGTTFEHKEVYEYGSPATDVGTSDTTILSVPSGKTFYARTVVITNTAASAVTVDIYDGSGGTHKMKVTVPATTTWSLSNIKGLTFTSAVVAVADATGATMTVSGELTE